jgi:CubicO group peptidase (beta-lactamase class C family)
MKIKLIIFLVLILLQSCKEKSNPETKIDKVKQVESSLIKEVYIEGDSLWNIEERMDHYGVPGVSIAIIYDHKIEWSKSYGVVTKDTRIPVTSQTLFQAGSISKPVSAYGALKLVEDKKIDLNQNVNTYLQSWKIPDNKFTDQKKVSLKHLLNHSGGVTVHGFLGYSPDLAVPTLVQVLDGSPPANSPAILVDKMPEESFRYSGGGYTIMQQLMIDLEKKPFPQIMKELVLDPLGMSHSTYNQPLTGEQLALAATGYLPNGQMTKGKRHTYPEMAAAGLWTTAEDLALFAIDLQNTFMGDSQKVLSQNMATQMLTPFVEDFIGLGIFLNNYGDEVYFGHGGWDEGFSSEMMAHKKNGYGVVVLTNSNHPDFISELIRAVAMAYNWENYLGVYKKLSPTSEDIEKVVGRYRKNNDDLFEIYVSKNNLYGKNLGLDSIPMIKITDTTYIRRDRNEPIQFKINPENGLVEMFMLNPYDGSAVSHFQLMSLDDKLPFEYLAAGDFTTALTYYKQLMKENPEDEVINENYLNRRGYNLLSGGKVELARDLFKINTLLYPTSGNVYDSYAEALMINKEFEQAILNYSKAISLDPKNENAVKMIEEIKAKM